MKENKEKINIFIDTSIFIGQNFDYQNQLFQRTVDWAKTKKIKVFITDITLREIEANINKKVIKAINICSACDKKKDLKILKNIGTSQIKKLFQRENKQKNIDELKCQLNSFIKDASIEILSTSKVSVEEVFNKYFTMKPPFGDGKKKYEFPDAFALFALEDWCNINKEKIYIISKDSDMIKYCETAINLISFKRLDDFTNFVETKNTDSKIIIELFKDNEEIIFDKLKSEFIDKDFWIEDHIGDVENISDIKPKIIKINLIKVEEDKKTAIVAITAETTFGADIIYDDLETAIYDSEDKILIPMQKIELFVDQTVEYTAIVTISYDSNSFNIDSFKIQNDDFSINIDNEY